MDLQKTLDEINSLEKTEKSFIKIGGANKKLIVSFASNEHTGFERKTSLLKLRESRNDFDILYLRSPFTWYLLGLNGIGNDINDTIYFLEKEFKLYDSVICLGNSSGGFASILFGSILKSDFVISLIGQTDLEYCLKNLSIEHFGHDKLLGIKTNHPEVWLKYQDLSKVITNDVCYRLFYNSDQYWIDKQCNDSLILHDSHHLNNIINFDSVSTFESEPEGPNVLKQIRNCFDN